MSALRERPTLGLRPIAHRADLEELCPEASAEDRLDVRLPVSGARTVWLRIFGTEWFEQVEVHQSQPA